jgi:antitoxin VapB
MYTQGGIMLTTRVFKNGNSQALRIPQELRTDENEYCINKIGDIFIAYPAKDPWSPVRKVIGTFSKDFMSDRDEPSWDDVSDKEEF